MAEVQAQLKDQTVECVQGRLVEIQGMAAVRICTKAAEGDQELVEMQSITRTRVYNVQACTE